MPSTFGVVSHGAATASWDPTATDGNRDELGTIRAFRTGDQWALVQCVQLDNNGCTLGDVLVYNPATLKQYSVKKAGTGDRGAPLVGVAVATIASQFCGYMVIGGYVEKAAISQSVASGEYLCIGGSTAGALTPNRASVFNNGTQGNASAFMVMAVAKGLVATTSTLVASIQLCGVWGV